MADAILEVVQAGPLVSYQDGGRRGHLRYGVPASGPMDRFSHALANVSIGNAPESTAVEVSLGGIQIQCRAGEVTIAIAGGGFRVERSSHASQAKTGSPTPAIVQSPAIVPSTGEPMTWAAVTVRDGDQITIAAGPWGSWTYLALAGEIVANRWLDRTSTYAPSDFGGGLIRAGDRIEIHQARIDLDREGEIPEPTFARPDGRVRVVLGPQDRLFEPEAVGALQDGPFTLSSAYDRMGVRLDGPRLFPRKALSIPSEPIIRGSIQVAGDGVPTVLLADHQTTGGYPKIATVVACDLDRFCQHRSGDGVVFEVISPAAAIDLARIQAERETTYLEKMSQPGRTITQRLLQHNLIGGVFDMPSADS